MKPKSRFATLLSAGGSLLSKDALGRRLRLPQKEMARQARGEERNGADVLVLQEAANGDEDKAVPIVTPKAQSKLSVLSLMIQQIVRESRGGRRARQL